MSSPVAVALTTGTLARLREEPGLRRAEALRRTMVELIEHGPDPHPAYWAPFVVVGEGGAPPAAATRPAGPPAATRPEAG